MTFQEITIMATGLCITNQLRDVNTLSRRSWYIAAHIWKIYHFKIEIVPFIIHFSTELTTVDKFEVYVQKWCGRSCKNDILLVFTPICFVRRFMFYLCYFYLFTYSGVQHELLTYSDHMNSPLYKVNSCATHFLVVCAIFCGTLFAFVPFTSTSILRQTLIIDSCLMGSAHSISFSYMNWPCLQTTY